ncbi:MAG: hypothetical protein L0Y71_14020 [Gemmataceae bacterium]|nr:hypothetical protein [Gemmataceae bacterium]
MAEMITYEQVVALAVQLPAEDQKRLAQQLLASAHEPPLQRRNVMEFSGIVPYPLCGEDAQAWVTRTRGEWDEREKQLRH